MSLFTLPYTSVLYVSALGDARKVVLVHVINMRVAWGNLSHHCKSFSFYSGKTNTCVAHTRGAS